MDGDNWLARMVRALECGCRRRPDVNLSLHPDQRVLGQGTPLTGHGNLRSATPAHAFPARVALWP